MVLLKNDGALPFAANVKKILVVGPLADSVEVLHGNYSGTASHAVTALEGISKQFAAAQVSFVPGTNFLRQKPVIPTSVLSTDDGKPGLEGGIFRRRDFIGTPQLARVDPVVDLQLVFIPIRMRSRPPTDEGVFGALDRLSDPG